MFGVQAFLFGNQYKVALGVIQRVLESFIKVFLGVKIQILYLCTVTKISMSSALIVKIFDGRPKYGIQERFDPAMRKYCNDRLGHLMKRNEQKTGATSRKLSG